MRKMIFPMLLVLGGGLVVGCDTSTPNSPAQQTAMRDEAHDALKRMEAQDPSLVNDISNAAGYVVFPEVGAGAVGVGGAHGQGYLYQNGHRIGMVKMTQGSIGPQIGGETYAELIIFQDQNTLNKIMNNAFEFGSDASAIAVKAGAAGAAQFTHGTQVYIMQKGGLYAGAAINGQKFHFYPSEQTSTQSNVQTNDNGTTTTETHTETHNP